MLNSPCRGLISGTVALVAGMLEVVNKWEWFGSRARASVQQVSAKTPTEMEIQCVEGILKVIQNK